MTPGRGLVEHDECLLEKNNILIKALAISLQVGTEWFSLLVFIVILQESQLYLWALNQLT